jgi:hypothetical protein
VFRHLLAGEISNQSFQIPQKFYLSRNPLPYPPAVFPTQWRIQHMNVRIERTTSLLIPSYTTACISLLFPAPIPPLPLPSLFALLLNPLLRHHVFPPSRTYAFLRWKRAPNYIARDEILNWKLKMLIGEFKSFYIAKETFYGIGKVSQSYAQFITLNCTVWVTRIWKLLTCPETEN